VVEEKTGRGTGPGGRLHAAQVHLPQGAWAPRGAVQEGALIDTDEEPLRRKREAQAVPAGAPAHQRGAARERGGLGPVVAGLAEHDADGAGARELDVEEPAEPPR